MDGGQTPTEIARELAGFLGAAQTSLDIAVYDVRFETDAGALVLAISDVSRLLRRRPAAGARARRLPLVSSFPPFVSLTPFLRL